MKLGNIASVVTEAGKTTHQSLLRLEGEIESLKKQLSKIVRNDAVVTTTTASSNHAHRHATGGSGLVDTGDDPLQPYTFTWGNAHTWQLGSDVVAQTLKPYSAQTADLMRLYATDGSTIRAIWDSESRLGIRDATPSAFLSIQGQSDPEATVTALSPILWLDASNADLQDNATLSDNSTVSRWEDRSSGGHDAILFTETPKLFTTAGGSNHPDSLANSKPVVSLAVAGSSWDALDNYTAATVSPAYPRYIADLSAFTMCAVIQTLQGAGNATGTILGGDPVSFSGANQGGRIQLVFESGDYYLICRYMNVGGDNYYKAGPISYPLGDWMRVTLTRTGSTHTFYVNDEAVPQFATNGTLTSNLPIVYLQAYATNGSYPVSDTHVAEVLLFNSVLSAGDLASVWAYLDSKYYDGTNYYANTGGAVSADPLTHWKNSSGTVDSVVTSGLLFGIGTAAPAAKLHSVSTTEPLRLSYSTSGSTDVTFAVSSSGDLTITPDGGDATVAGTVTVSTSSTPQLVLLNNGSNLANFTVSASGDLTVAPSGLDMAVTARVAVTDPTGPQLTLINNGSNQAAITVGSSGLTNFNATGSAAGFSFSDFVGIGASPPVALHVINAQTGATEPSTFKSQMRVGYDGSNYFYASVASNGNTTFSTVSGGAETLGVGFDFLDKLVIKNQTAANTILQVEGATSQSGRAFQYRTVGASVLLFGVDAAGNTIQRKQSTPTHDQSYGKVYTKLFPTPTYVDLCYYGSDDTTASGATGGAEVRLTRAGEVWTPIITRGDIYVRGSGGLAALPIGASGTILRSDGTDPGWSSLATAGVASSSLILTAGNGLTGGGDLSADRTFNVAAADSTITVNTDSIQVNQAASYSWNTGTHTFATETVHNGGLDIGTSGRFDSNVANAAGAFNFLFQPTTAFTSGSDRDIFAVRGQAGATANYLRVLSNGAVEAGAGSSGGQGTAQIYSLGPTDTGNMAVGVYCNFSAGSSTCLGLSLTGVSSALAGGHFLISNNRLVVDSGGTNTSLFGGAFDATLQGTNPASTKTIPQFFGGSFRSTAVASVTNNVITLMGGVITQPSALAMSFTTTNTPTYACFYAGAASAGATPAFTDKYGLYVAADHASAAITNQYGVYVTEQTRGSSLKYGIFLASATSTYKALAIGETGNWVGWGGSGLLSLNAATSVDVNNILTVTGTIAGGHIQLNDKAVAAGGLATNGYVYADDGTNNPKGIYSGDGANASRVMGLLYSATDDKTVTSTISDTTLFSSTGAGSYTIAANFFDKAGKTLRIMASGYYSSKAAPVGDLRMKLLLVDAGSNVDTLLDTGAGLSPTASMTTQEWFAEMIVTCRSTGGTGTLYSQGYITFWTAATTSVTWRLASTATVTVDTTELKDVRLTAIWGTGDASNTITCTNAVIYS